MDLIDRDELRMIVYSTERCNGKTALIEAFSILINSALKVDAIPIEWIEKWLSDRRSCLERTASEISIKQIIADWEAENRRKHHETVI